MESRGHREQGCVESGVCVEGVCIENWECREWGVWRVKDVVYPLWRKVTLGYKKKIGFSLDPKILTEVHCYGNI